MNQARPLVRIGPVQKVFLTAVSCRWPVWFSDSSIVFLHNGVTRGPWSRADPRRGEIVTVGFTSALVTTDSQAEIS
jgi:hypothetical protein